MDFSAALPTFVVTLREGFEAALVVGIVLACLKKAQQTQLNRWVYQGIGGGIVASIMVGFLLGGIMQGVESSNGLYTPVVKEILAGIFGLVAIAMLSWMLIWMTQQAKSLKSEVEGAIRTALEQNSGAGKAICLLIFIAVLREGFETVLFIIAKFQEGWTLPGIGVIAGLVMAAGIGVLLFKWGVKINIGLFFQVMGILLLLIVGGLVVGALKHFDAAVTLVSQLDWNYAGLCIYNGASCILGPQVWDASGILPEREFPGIILKSLFGYRQTLYLVQAIVYVMFLAIVGGAYFRSLSGRAVLETKNKASVGKA
ncbi:MAG: FTR1 family protein [Xenococcaceae cyanobacterium]